MNKYKYSGVTKENIFIQSNKIEDFQLQHFKEIMITETMTRKEIEKHFGRDYKLPEDLRRIKKIKIKK